MIIVSGNTFPLHSFLHDKWKFKFKLGKEDVWYKGMTSWYEKMEFVEDLHKEMDRLGLKEYEVNVEED